MFFEYLLINLVSFKNMLFKDALYFINNYIGIKQLIASIRYHKLFIYFIEFKKRVQIFIKNLK